MGTDFQRVPPSESVSNLADLIFQKRDGFERFPTDRENQANARYAPRNDSRAIRFLAPRQSLGTRRTGFTPNHSW